MKGVVLSRCPRAQLVDLTHEIPAGDVRGGAFQLALAAPYFPEQTVFLAVVDPGVGSERRPICLAAGGRHFVGPDNGLLWPAAAALAPPEAVRIENPDHRLSSLSATFHGRDLFAPAAADLAAGLPCGQLGPAIDDPVRLVFPRPRRVPGGVDGEVLWVDRFGNLITNIVPGEAPEPPLVAAVANVEIEGPAPNYSAVDAGGLCIVISSGGTYEIAARRESAALRLGVGVGSAVRLRAGRRSEPVR